MAEIISIRSPDGSMVLECCPATGGSITAFRHNGVDMFRPYDPALPADPLNMASFPLTPYSNRIIDCKLRFEGREFYVGPPFGQEPHQLHGDGWRLPWQLMQQDAHQVTLSLATERRDETPYVYEATQTFRFDHGLMIEMSVTNRSAQRLPFGLGHHPYFPRNDKTVLKAKLPKVWRSKNIVPQECIDTPKKWDFSKGIALSDAHFAPPRQGFAGQDLLDHCFSGWDQQAEIHWPDTKRGLRITADPVFRDFVIYIPHAKPFFCAEPVTHVIDAFNLTEKGVMDTGTVVLEDGQSLSGRMHFAPRAA